MLCCGSYGDGKMFFPFQRFCKTHLWKLSNILHCYLLIEWMILQLHVKMDAGDKKYCFIYNDNIAFLNLNTNNLMVTKLGMLPKLLKPFVQLLISHFFISFSFSFPFSFLHSHFAHPGPFAHPVHFDHFFISF